MWIITSDLPKESPRRVNIYSKHSGVYPRVIHMLGKWVVLSIFLLHIGCTGRSFTHRQCHIHTSLYFSATFYANLPPRICEYKDLLLTFTGFRCCFVSSCFYSIQRSNLAHKAIRLFTSHIAQKSSNINRKLFMFKNKTC